MSIDAMNWAWRQKNLTVGQKLVLLALADRASETHACWPSMTRLTQDTGLSDRGIRKIYTELEALRLIRWEHRPGLVTVFTLLGVDGREATPEPGSGGPRNSVPREPKEEPKENPKKKYSALADADAVHSLACAPQADEKPGASMGRTGRQGNKKAPAGNTGATGSRPNNQSEVIMRNNSVDCQLPAMRGRGSEVA